MSAENLNQSEQICALLDGQLDETQAQNLYYNLAQNPDLQREMQDHLAMRNVFENGAIPPPPALKTNILAKTGLAAGAFAFGSLGGSVASFFSGAFLKSKIFLAAASVLIGVGGTLLFFGDGDSLRVNTEKIPDAELNASDAPILSLNLPERIIHEDKSSNLRTSPPPPRIIYIEKDLAKDDENRDATQSQTPIAATDAPTAKTINLIVKPVSGAEESLANDRINPVAFELVPVENEKSTRGDFTLQARYFSSNSLLDETVSPLANPALNNISFAVLRNIDENDAVGIEFGQENFYQEFFGELPSGDKIDYRQNFIAFWYGLSWLHRYGDELFFDGLTPYARVFVGGCEVGPMLRGAAGFEYWLSPTFALNAGAETSWLIYAFDGNYFTSGKVGANIGLSVDF